MRLARELQFSRDFQLLLENLDQPILKEIQEVSLLNSILKKEIMTWWETILLSFSSETQSNSQTSFTAKREILKMAFKIPIWHGISGV
jgi:hypothetical protein